MVALWKPARIEQDEDRASNVLKEIKERRIVTYSPWELDEKDRPLDNGNNGY